jgi:DNA polymerase
MSFFTPSSWETKDKRQPTIARCGLCGLLKHCYSPKMQPSGLGKNAVLFITGAPTKEEDRQGTQFVDDAGNLLKAMLKEIGVKLDECWKSHSVLCRPKDDKVESKHIQSCQPSVFNSIKELQPNVIVLLGDTACESILQPAWKKGLGPISRWAGWSIPMLEHNAWVVPTYHPKDVLESKDGTLLRNIIMQHLELAFSLKDKPIKAIPTIKLQEQVEILQNERSIKSRLRDLLTKKGLLAFDYETTGLKPERDEQKIVSCSFCFEGEDTFAFPWSPEIERLVSKILLSPNLGKIASNLKFEERWTRRKLGHGVENWNWDTMNAAHILDNRQAISSIKFQAFVHLGIGDYNSHLKHLLESEYPNELNRVHEINIKDLLLYNGMDSLLEFKVSEIQKEIMN